MMHSRRTALKTLGTASLAMMPFMRSLAAHANGDVNAIPKRFVFVMKSSGIDKHNLMPLSLGSEYSKDRDKLVNLSLKNEKLPAFYDGFKGLEDQLTVVQGLSGKNFRGAHTAGFGALSCHYSSKTAIAPTVDCILGKHLSQGPFPIYGMAQNGNLFEQFYNGPENNFCYPNISAFGKGQALAFQASPRKAYMELFGSMVTASSQLKKDLTLNSNLMDFMKEDAKRIEKQLSAEDKERFANYTQAFESLKEREFKKVKYQERIKKHAPKLTSRYDSLEPAVRSAMHFELATSALITGITNVVTLRPDTLGVQYNSLGISEAVHTIGHLNGKTTNGWDRNRARMEIDKYHLNSVAKMARKLKSIPEGNGTMLDNTVIVYTSCAGGDHHAGQGDWPFIMVGGMAGNLNTGRYIQYPSYPNKGHRTLGNLYLSLMQAAGINTGETFGQTDSGLKDLDLKGPLAEFSA